MQQNTRGQGVTCHISLSLHKNFIESTLKTAITEHIHCIIFYLFHECLSGRGYRFQILEGMTCHLEVQVTWEQHETPWRSGLSLDEKESPWRQMDLMLPKVLSLERNIHTSSWKIAWEMTPWRPINHVTGWSESIPDSGEPRTII